LGRGILFSLIARVFFVGGGYIIHIYAGRKLGLTQYGTLGVVLSILAISYLFLNNGVKQAVSRMTAVYPQAAKKIFHKGLFVQYFFIACIVFVLSVFSETISRFFRDTNLITPLRYLSVVVLSQGIFFVITGSLNGLKRFLAQNIVIGTYSVMRPIGVVVLIWLGFGVNGVVLGFLIASVLAATVGLSMVSGFPDEELQVEIPDIWSAAVGNIIIFGCVATLLNMDLLFVKRLMVGNDSAGLYTAASTFSKIPQRFLYSFGFISLPLVATSYDRGDFAQCKVYISQVFRYSTLVFLPVIVIISATSKDLLTFFYGSDYVLAGSALQILIFGIWFVGLISILAHLMIAIGKGRLMALMSVCIIIFDAFLNMILIPKFGLTGAALSTSASAFVLVSVSGGYIINKIGLAFAPLTAFRLTALSLLLYFVAHFSFFEKIPLLFEYAILYFVFALGLIITQEIGTEDWAVAKRLVQQRQHT